VPARASSIPAMREGLALASNVSLRLMIIPRAHDHALLKARSLSSKAIQEYKKYKRYRQDIVAAVFESGFFVYRMGVLKIARND